MDRGRSQSQGYPEKRPETSMCLVCDGTMGPDQRLTGLLRCRVCGFVTADLAISGREIEAIYGRDYFHGREYADYEFEGPSLKLNFRRRLQTLKRFVPDHSGKRLFEIGCAYGFFLELARSEFMCVGGVDISDDAVRYA